MSLLAAGIYLKNSLLEIHAEYGRAMCNDTSNPYKYWAPVLLRAENCLAYQCLEFNFSKYKGTFKDIDSVKDRDDALVVALEFEKATLGFYRAVEEVEGSSEVLKTVIDAEKSHIVAIMKALLVEGSKFRGLQDDWGS